MLAKLVVGINSLMFFVFAIMFLFWPEKYVQDIFFTLENNSAIVEIIAMYGGLDLGFSLFLAYCLWKKENLHMGLLAIALILGCMGISRTVAIVTLGKTNFLMKFFAGVEFMNSGLAFYLFKKTNT